LINDFLEIGLKKKDRLLLRTIFSFSHDFLFALLQMLDAVGMHDAFVAIRFSVAACYARAIHCTDVAFMFIVIGFVVAGIRQVFFAGSQAQRQRKNYQAVGKECFHVFEF
jgi:hypothetical protein